MGHDETLVLQASPAEVEQEADVQPSCPEVVEALDLRVGMKMGGHLQLDDDTALDHKIRDEGPDDLIVVPNFNRPLLLYIQP